MPRRVLVRVNVDLQAEKVVQVVQVVCPNVHWYRKQLDFQGQVAMIGQGGLQSCVGSGCRVMNQEVDHLDLVNLVPVESAVVRVVGPMMNSSDWWMEFAQEVRSDHRKKID